MSDYPQKKTWMTLETFTEEGSSLAVEVQSSQHAEKGYTIYSWRDGRVVDGRFVMGHRPRGRAEGGVVNLEYTDTDALARLIKRAEAFIHDKRQASEDEFQANRRRQADQQDRRNLGNKPKGGKSNGHRGNGSRHDRDW